MRLVTVGLKIFLYAKLSMKLLLVKKNKSNVYTLDNLKDKTEEFNHFFSSLGKTIYNRYRNYLELTPSQPFTITTRLSILACSLDPKPVDTNEVIFHTGTVDNIHNLITT